MRIAIICPSPDLNKFAVLSDVHLLLTHLVGEGNDYTKFYAGRKELKILDNGLFEHHVASPTPEILSKAKLVGADVVIAPDVLYNPVETVENAKVFAKAVNQENGIRRGKGMKPLQMMAVPQASNQKDYLWCYKTLCDLGYQWIGLSILACPKSFGNTEQVFNSRKQAYRALRETGIWNDKVNHHLLGLGSEIDELEFFAPVSSVVSNDSSSAVLHGQLGITYTNGIVPGGKKKEKLNFEVPTDLKFEASVLSNIAEWKALATFQPRGQHAMSNV